MTEPIKTKATAVKDKEMELATFYVGDMLLGADIHFVEEINRQLAVTPVPQAPASVRGVINLRGDVVTVIDLRRVLGMEPAELTKQNRNVVIRTKNGRVALLVDRVADVITFSSDQIDPPPANFRAVDGRFFEGIYRLPTELLVILNIEAVLSDEACQHSEA